MTKPAPTRPRATATVQDPRWQAVVDRDARCDGQFVYSVRTTGVFCRPSCPSRRANPENVQFHATNVLARQAGFRPCLRCRPEASDPLAHHRDIVSDLCRHIQCAPTPPTLAELALRSGLSAFHLHRIFKAHTGLTPRAFAHAQRAQRLRHGLGQGSSVTEAIFDAGYNSGGRFYAESDRILGMTPSRYRSGGAGADIRYALGACDLGTVLVAQSERGVCAIFLGDSAAAVQQQLRERFAQARLVTHDAEFAARLAHVVSFVETPGRGLRLPLDVRGTAFQQRVWRALQDIPAGHTASYAQVAASIGAPNASRAVAAACAANPLAVAIPCHRVVRSDGAVSGYRWGVERKQALLAREAAAAPAPLPARRTAGRRDR